MRKIDIERNRDYYKGCLKSSLRLLTIMTQRYEEWEEHSRNRINELESEIKKLKGDLK